MNNIIFTLRKSLKRNDQSSEWAGLGLRKSARGLSNIGPAQPTHGLPNLGPAHPWAIKYWPSPAHPWATHPVKNFLKDSFACCSNQSYLLSLSILLFHKVNGNLFHIINGI